LIRACQILRQRGRAFRLEIIGRGPLRRRLEARATELGITDRVRFLGARPQEFVREAYKRAPYSRSRVLSLQAVIATRFLERDVMRWGHSTPARKSAR